MTGRSDVPIAFPLRLLAVLATPVLLVALSPRLLGQTANTDQVSGLTVAGNADVRVAPDLADVELGVVTEAPSATDARQQNASRVGKVITAIKALGIPDNMIRTSVFQLEPVRRFANQNQQGEPPIVGYRVSNIVGVRTSNLDLVPRIIDDSIKAGANTVNSVGFMLSDEASARQSALRQAIADAKANASVMAKELGVTLGRVLNATQGGASVQPPVPMYRMASESVSAPTPILPGEVTVSASVTVTYQIR